MAAAAAAAAPPAPDDAAAAQLQEAAFKKLYSEEYFDRCVVCVGRVVLPAAACWFILSSPRP
jgi:hypothetical protein